MESDHAILCPIGCVIEADAICVVVQAGMVVREGVFDSDSESISIYVRSKTPEEVRIGLETGPTSTWLWTELKGMGCR
jgi:transposase